MKAKLILSLFAFLLVACAPQASASSGGMLTSGVKGQTVIGPACPVMRVDNPCPDQPYQANLTVLSLDGREVTRFSSDAAGKFEIQLPPGDYILHANLSASRPLPSAEDVPFTVLPNEFTEIVINFDSGIR